jgi:catechol 2,3-dioxygenase-like lactoylglutathione lyase family enzyme
MVDQSSVPEHARKRADPPSFRARNLSASLTVNDLQRSLAWYRDIVGFAVDLMHERDGRLNSVTLKAGDVRLRLSQDDGPAHQGTRGHARCRAGRHALGHAPVPAARSRRIPTRDLLDPGQRLSPARPCRTLEGPAIAGPSCSRHRRSRSIGLRRGAGLRAGARWWWGRRRADTCRTSDRCTRRPRSPAGLRSRPPGCAPA